MYDTWRTKRAIEPFLLLWPSAPILDDDGEAIGGGIRFELPRDRASWSNDIREAVSRVEASFMLLCEEQESQVLLILESAAGTTSWVLPIERRGDVNVLGRESTYFNQHRIGVLWLPRRGQA